MGEERLEAAGPTFIIGVRESRMECNKTRLCQRSGFTLDSELVY